MSVRRCPQCGTAVLRPAREGGAVFLSRVTRIDPAGTVIAKCPQVGCEAELEVCKGNLLRLRLRVPLRTMEEASNG